MSQSLNLSSRDNHDKEEHSFDVLRKIEQLILSLIDFLNKEESPILSEVSKLHKNIRAESAGAPATPGKPATPGTTATTLSITKRFNLMQCRSFTGIILVLSYVYTLLQSHRTTTTREVYYFYVTHFRSQKECDAAIFDAALLVGVPRSVLGLTASPKGWFCGSFSITHHRTNTVVDGTALASMHGLPITREWIDRSNTKHVQAMHNTPFSVTSKKARCILVIEKEGVYNRLSEDRFFESHYPCILVTGKGFPDLATRALVFQLHHELDLPVFGICDCNPFGIGVLQTFVCGSQKIGLDGGDRYGVPIQWLGLRPSHIEATSLKNSLPKEVFQRLTDIDKRRIRGLKSETSPFLRGRDREERLEELFAMESNGYKMELEALHWLGMDFMSAWIHDTLVHNQSANNTKNKRHDNIVNEDDDRKHDGTKNGLESLSEGRTVD